jgi:hypothetical protein
MCSARPESRSGPDTSDWVLLRKIEGRKQKMVPWSLGHCPDSTQSNPIKHSKRNNLTGRKTFGMKRAVNHAKRESLASMTYPMRARRSLND